MVSDLFILSISNLSQLSIVIKRSPWSFLLSVFHEDGSRTVLTALPATFGMQIENETKVRLKSSGHKILNLQLGYHAYWSPNTKITKIIISPRSKWLPWSTIQCRNYNVLLNQPGYHHFLEHYHQDHQDYLVLDHDLLGYWPVSSPALLPLFRPTK